MLRQKRQGCVEVFLPWLNVAAEGEDGWCPAACDGDGWISERQVDRRRWLFDGEGQAANEQKLMEQRAGTMLCGGFDEVECFFLKKCSETMG